MTLIARFASLLLVLIFIAGCPAVLRPPGADEGTTRTRLTQAEIDSTAYSLPELMYHGRNLSIRNWQLDDGFGNARTRSAPNIDRLPGPDSTSCTSCHGLRNGVILGWGNNAANVLVAMDSPTDPTIGGSNERNTPAEHGLSLLELLGREMSDPRFSPGRACRGSTVLGGEGGRVREQPHRSMNFSVSRSVFLVLICIHALAPQEFLRV